MTPSMEPLITVTQARLRAAIDRSTYNQSSLAKAIGVTQGTIGQILSGEIKKSKHLPDIADALGVGLDWLMGKDVERAGLDIDDAGDDDRERVQIMEIDVGYGMGGGTFIDGYIDGVPRDFDPGWLEAITQSPPSMLFIAKGIGDSMMPTLLDNDLLVVDRGQTTITQQDRIWAVTYGELGMVKRVRRRADGTYLLMSDNPLISAIEAVAGEMHVVGRVVFIGRKA